jgi:hypothetical protein
MVVCIITIIVARGVMALALVTQETAIFSFREERRRRVEGRLNIRDTVRGSHSPENNRDRVRDRLAVFV